MSNSSAASRFIAQTSPTKPAIVYQTAAWVGVLTLKWLVVPSAAAPAIRTISTKSAMAVTQQMRATRRGRPRTKVNIQSSVKQ